MYKIHDGMNLRWMWEFLSVPRGRTGSEQLDKEY